ncbi:MAG: hypothetical protein AB1847_01145 [bacterium]
MRLMGKKTVGKKTIDKKAIGMICTILILIISISAIQWRTHSSRQLSCQLSRQYTARSGNPDALGIGNVKKLMATYNRWKVLWSQAVGEQNLILSLTYVKGQSAKFTRARGQAVINLVDGSVQVEVSGLPGKGTYDVWMLGRHSGTGHPGTGHRQEGSCPDHDAVNLGTLKGENGTVRLKAQAGCEVPASLEIDYVVVACTGQDPAKTGLLFGSPSLFQKLYYNERSGRLAMVGEAEEVSDSASTGGTLSSAACRFLVPSPAYADNRADNQKEKVLCSLQKLIDQGEYLFFHETFKGNGRTCGTCHPATNNFTLDPAYIKTLEPCDPLFVAENNPALAELEKPELMRKFALILENVDGFDDPTTIFVMRSVPHLLGLSNTILSDPSKPGEYPVQRTGWSGDGAPGTGSLREFAIGAVKQHFTKSLARVEGADFRLPSDDELDALEAFQLSLGRQEELDLESMHFTSESAELGKTTFLDKNPDDPRAGKCQRCHANAGSNSSSTLFNDNRNTGVEVMEAQPARLVDSSIPIDGGFGLEPNPDGSYGDGTFNITSVIEAADTPPYFHNNAINTLEAAVSFYNDDAFNNSPSGITHQGLVKLEATQVEAVAAFLRIINAMDNINSSNRYDELAKGASCLKGRKLLEIAISETEDAIEVLSRGVFLHPDAVSLLEKARLFEITACASTITMIRNSLIDKAIASKNAAYELMIASS